MKITDSYERLREALESEVAKVEEAKARFQERLNETREYSYAFEWGRHLDVVIQEQRARTAAAVLKLADSDDFDGDLYDAYRHVANEIRESFEWAPWEPKSTSSSHNEVSRAICTARAKFLYDFRWIVQVIENSRQERLRAEIETTSRLLDPDTMDEQQQALALVLLDENMRAALDPKALEQIERALGLDRETVVRLTDERLGAERSKVQAEARRREQERRKKLRERCEARVTRSVGRSYDHGRCERKGVETIKDDEGNEHRVCTQHAKKLTEHSTPTRQRFVKMPLEVH